jgi:hypothetical protein
MRPDFPRETFRVLTKSPSFASSYPVFFVDDALGGTPAYGAPFGKAWGKQKTQERVAMSTIIRLDDCLSKPNGRLFVEECLTPELVQRFGSPLFVLSEDQIRRNVRRFQ